MDKKLEKIKNLNLLDIISLWLYQAVGNELRKSYAQWIGEVSVVYLKPWP